MESVKKIVAKGQYATRNKFVFKGKTMLENDNVIEVSIYMDKNISEEELNNLQLLLNFSDAAEAMKAKKR